LSIVNGVIFIYFINIRKSHLASEGVIIIIIIKIDDEQWEIEASSPLEVLQALSLLPDSYLILRDNVPIPIDEPLNNGDIIRAIKVASGG